MQLLHSVQVQAVALIKTAGDVHARCAAQLHKKFIQQRAGGHSIHVIIAVDGDGCFIVQRQAQNFYRRVHVFHQKRVRLRAWRAVHKRARGLVIADAAVIHQLPEQTGEFLQFAVDVRWN